MNKIAYLVSDYFAPSHTFVRREVASLRQLGAKIIPFTVQSVTQDSDTNEKDVGGPVESLLGRSFFDYPLALLWAFFTSPLRFGSSWLLALRHRPPGVRGLVWSQFHFVEAMLMARLLKKSGCDRLHNHFANSGATVGMIAAHFGKWRWSLTLHGISETDFPAGLLLAEKLRRADFVACASHFMRAQAMRIIDVAYWPKLHIIHCGVDLTSLPSSHQKNSPNQKDEEALSQHATVHLVCVGRLSPEKGYFGLLDILARLSSDGPDFFLTIVGDGPSDHAIRAKVEALSLTDRVHFTGALPEKEALEEISRGDIFILPSLMEGLPVVLIEALAMGKAAIASRVAGIPELIEDGHSGLLFTPSDWDDLEHQLRRLLADGGLRQSLGEHGRTIVEQQFDIMIPAKQLRQLFSSGQSPSITRESLG